MINDNDEAIVFKQNDTDVVPAIDSLEIWMNINNHLWAVTSCLS